MKNIKFRSLKYQKHYYYDDVGKTREYLKDMERASLLKKGANVTCEDRCPLRKTFK